jgi:hypothetical protein
MRRAEGLLRQLLQQQALVGTQTQAELRMKLLLSRTGLR